MYGTCDALNAGLMFGYHTCRETNSIACHGAPGVSNTAGAALWVVDYALQAATLGISEAYFHEGVGYKYNFVRFRFDIGITESRVTSHLLDRFNPSR